MLAEQDWVSQKTWWEGGDAARAPSSAHTTGTDPRQFS